MNLIVIRYRYRKDWWGHTVEIKQPDSVTTGATSNIEEVITWATENSQARRISYDTWQFRSQTEADQFIMLYKLRWGS